MKTKLKSIIEDSGSTQGRIFALSVQALIIVSLISFSIETISNLSVQTLRVLRMVEVVTVALFTVEYLLRLYVADKKLKFIFSFYGLIDLLAILPFYIARGIDLRAIRVFRMFRLFRIFKALRYGKAIERFMLAFKSIKEEMILFLITITILVYLSSIGIYYCESKVQPEVFSSVFQSLWWSIVTLTTVGYGDAYPITAAGRLFAALVMLMGVGIVAVPSGLIASALTRVIRAETQKD